MNGQTFILNGSDQPLRKVTLRQLCDEMGLEKGFAVERNGEIVPRSRLSEVFVEAGDRIEIVHMVGGG